jgi:hypothetical protein
MVSRRKLEEEIARSKDPVLQKQLQELLEKRSQRWAEKGKKAKDYFNRADKEIIPSLMAGVAIVIWVAIAIGLILALFFLLIGHS